ncbi:MAG: KH domain-containing protein [Acidobacteriota bacterium]
MRDLIELIAKSLVDDPESVRVEQVENESTTLLELEVAPEDVGRVIGRHGRTVQALRTILDTAGIKWNRDFSLEILE